MGVDDEVRKLLDIPRDEPIFILRGRDRLARRMVQRYFIEAHSIADASQRPPKAFFDQAEKVTEAFDEFAMNHPERLTYPD